MVDTIHPTILVLVLILEPVILVTIHDVHYPLEPRFLQDPLKLLWNLLLQSHFLPHYPLEPWFLQDPLKLLWNLL